MNARQKGSVHVAMLGARMHYAVPVLLDKHGLLGRFYTDNYLGNKPWLSRLLSAIPTRLRSRAITRWLGRKAEIDASKVVSFESLGFHTWWRRKRAGDSIAFRTLFADGNRRFNELILRRGMNDVGLIFGFNGAALELFRFAKTNREIATVLEQTIAPGAIQKRLLSEELERWSGWQPGLTDDAGPDPLSEREQAEWRLADVIIGGSQFVCDGLTSLGVDRNKCVVVPYGIDLARFRALPKKPKSDNEPLRVLFAGEVGLRKGAPYLLEALRLLGPAAVQGRFAGSVALAPEKLLRYQQVATFFGAVPRQKMKELIDWADVFVLPSICEGSATVIYEALASGIPAIATPNSGSLIRNGVDGHIVPIQNPEAIAQALHRYFAEPEYLMAHRGAAIAGRQRLGLDRYGADLAQTLGRMLIPQRSP